MIRSGGTVARDRLKARQVMTDDSESVALRPTVIDGKRQEDDYEVIWRGLPIGRIMKPPTGSRPGGNRKACFR